MGWAENNQVYIAAQAGFRANMSTTDYIFTFHYLITHIINLEENYSVHLLILVRHLIT